MKPLERTLVLVKPDGLQRGLAGAVIARIESTGLKIVAMKMLHIDMALAKRHYSAHEGKGFFSGLVNFITSSPVIAVVFEGPNAIEIVRKLMGDTDPVKAAPGTIRGDYGLDIGRNVIHGSANSEDAATEVALFFSPREIYSYARDTDRWITEQ